MNDRITSARLATYIMVQYYNKLIKLANDFLEDSFEYIELVKMIREKVIVENNAYANMTKEDIEICLNEIKNQEINNDLLARYYSKLNYQKRIKDGGKVLDNSVLLSGVISAKISIDLLKKLDTIINNIDNNPNISEEDAYILKLYHITNKFMYFTSNTYLEKYALQYNFNIESMPSIEFSDIEKKYNVRFVDNITSVLANYIIDGINELVNLKSDDEYYRTYKSLTELSRFEVMLPYLNINSIKLIENSYNKENDTDITIRKIKKKIKERKEELNS